MRLKNIEKNEDTRLPESMDYNTIQALSAEVRQKLSLHRPETIGQASRLQGVTPASISILLVYLKTYKSSFMSELRQILLSGAEQMDLSLKDRQTEQLLSYLQLMTKWNKLII